MRGYECLLHSFFDELRAPEATLPNGRELPPIFEFTHEESEFIGPELTRQIVPPHLQMDPWFIARMGSLNRAKNEEEEE
jgi:glycogen synthase kinase 3 beta